MPTRVPLGFTAPVLHHMFQPRLNCFGSRCRLWENAKQESNPLEPSVARPPMLAFRFAIEFCFHKTKWLSGDAAALPRRSMIAAASSNAASWICKYSLMVIFGRMQSKFCAFVSVLDAGGVRRTRAGQFTPIRVLLRQCNYLSK